MIYPIIFGIIGFAVALYISVKWENHVSRTADIDNLIILGVFPWLAALLTFLFAWGGHLLINEYLRW